MSPAQAAAREASEGPVAAAVAPEVAAAALEASEGPVAATTEGTAVAGAAAAGTALAADLAVKAASL